MQEKDQIKKSNQDRKEKKYKWGHARRTLEEGTAG